MIWAQAPPAANGTTRPPAVLMTVQQLEELIAKGEVVAELGLDEAQIRDINQRLQAAQSDLNNEVQMLQLKRQDLPNIQQRIGAIHNRAKSEVEHLLLPQQVMRLRQLALQKKYSNQGLLVYTSEEFQRELGYSADLRTAIRGDLVAAEQEVRDAIERINAKTRARIQSRLTAEQLAKSESLVGPPFKFEKETPEQVRARIRNGVRR